jgi:hypothetical protein
MGMLLVQTGKCKIAQWMFPGTHSPRCLIIHPAALILYAASSLESALAVAFVVLPAADVHVTRRGCVSPLTVPLITQHQPLWAMQQPVCDVVQLQLAVAS